MDKLLNFLLDKKNAGKREKSRFNITCYILISYMNCVSTAKPCSGSRRIYLSMKALISFYEKNHVRSAMK